MGYYNPIYARGVDRFPVRGPAAGIDGLIVVDLPPEEDSELCLPAQAAGLNFIRLATPTTDAKRLPKVLQNTSGFVYYVSVTGITGTSAAQAADVGPEVARIKAATDLPVIVGFGITTPQAAQAIASIADGCVVGSAIVKLKSGRASRWTRCWPWWPNWPQARIAANTPCSCGCKARGNHRAHANITQNAGIASWRFAFCPAFFTDQISGFYAIRDPIHFFRRFIPME
jgi:hypothetical protein